MSRALTFWNDDNIRLIQENFIACSVPTWVCHAEGPEGEFLRSAGIDKHWVTSSGYMNCVSADGQLLGRQPCNEVLQAFAKIPAAQRKPGAVDVPALPEGKQAVPTPPEEGLVLRVHARFLARDNQGGLTNATSEDFPLMKQDTNQHQLFLEPNTEYMWLTREEAQALIPEDSQVDERSEVDAAIPIRMARFHLTPQRATTSEGGIQRARDIQVAELELIVREVTPERIRMDLSGQVHWGSDFDPALATTPNGPLRQGFQTPLYGRLEYDRRTHKFTRFDIVAPGEVWGRWGDANGNSMMVERPGRQPFGFAFELADGKSPTDRIPPGGNGRYVTERGYFD